MVAYFSSKYIKQAQAFCAVVLLSLCLLASHWVGFSHSISHSHSLSHQSKNIGSADNIPALNHSSDACQLFDALTLAGFVASQSFETPSHSTIGIWSSALTGSQIAKPLIESYRSRAPPSSYI